MSDDKLSLPSEKDLERELGDYLSNKYGGQVKIVSAGMLPFAKKKDVEQEARRDDDEAFYFDLKPEELVRYLDEYVVQQDEAKAVLATKICTHFNRIRHELETGRPAKRQVGRIKSNVLLIGPTGVGKTYLVKLIARRLGVPFVKGDATKFSETGYVGGDVEDLVRDLVREADDDISRAEFGIIYVDEVDKIAASPNRMGTDVSRAGVQRAFLKPMEETEVELKVPHDPVAQLEAMEHYRATGKREKKVVNTRNILFIMSGAFAGLTDHIKKRRNELSMGFGSKVESKTESSRYFQEVMAEDLIAYGFESEFVGRLPVVAALNELTQEDFVKILANHNSAVVLGKKQDFNAYGIKLDFEAAAFEAIAAKAVLEKTGARGLLSVMEKTLLPFEKSLPSTSCRHLVLSREMVEDPYTGLAAMLAEQEHDYHEQRYEELRRQKHADLVEIIANSNGDYLQEEGVALTAERLNMMADYCLTEFLDVREVCHDFVEMILHIRDYAATVSDESNFTVLFAEAAIDRILQKSKLTISSVNAVCETIFVSLDYGLRLIAQKKIDGELLIPVAGVDDPDGFINDLLDENFKL
ncbi:MAG: AAA family ATPase [Desulfobulbaceae bacterium]|nr:MAG: AAA family ATPase [Desulfobulbaceae bacterium]